MQEALVAESPAIISETSQAPAMDDPVFARLVHWMRKAFHAYFADGKGVPFDLQWRDGKPHRFGAGEPAFMLAVKSRAGISALASLDATSILEAYMADHIDIRGDLERLFAFRDLTHDRHPFRYAWSLIKPMVFGQTRMDRSGIASHYDHSREFYLSFLDRRHR